MSRFTKLLAAVALLGIPLAACDEGTVPPPVGSITGTVSIEGTGVDGVSVNLSNGNSTTTAGGGSYRFDNVDGGAYTVTISGFPSDATFDATSAAATISSAGQSITVNFTGAYIRTASVMGTVTVENMGLPGVTVTLTGVSGASAVTDAGGQYAFTGLRMGSYSVEISGFDSDEVGFSNTAASVAVGVGESKIVSFDGTYLRTAAIMGQVSIEGVGLEGVNVSLAGGPDGADMTTMTDAAGLYTFAKLRAGDYAVGISGYDTDEYEFEVTSQNVTVALGETANVPFDGILLRTSGIAGRVSVGGMGIAGVTVTVSADGMDDVTAMTDATGQYAVSALAAGDYTVTISGYDVVEYSFTDSQTVTLAMDMTEIVNFEGTALRSASIAVSVTADGAGLAGAAVTLTQITGATSGTVLGTRATDANGAAAFGPLLAGNYLVTIAVDSDEIDFESTEATIAVATAEAASVSFAGTINRTASISGAVTVDGAGMGGVSVALTGGEEDMSAETGDDGSYSFDGLRKGDYTVSITNPDENRYEFASTSENVSVAVGQTQSVSFAGSMVTSSSISGTVSIQGSGGLADVMVTLSGAASATDTTDAGGLYSFTGLGAGDYTVAISLSDDQEAAYNFTDTSEDVTLGDDDQQTANFMGTHEMSASVSGMLFVDEGPNGDNDMYDAGENALMVPGIPLVLAGPGVSDVNSGATDENGAFMFSDLVQGTYQLLVRLDLAAPEVAMALADFGYGGSDIGYRIELGVGAEHTKNIPFDITRQTVDFSVMLKSGDETGDALPGATVTLYADKDGEDKIAGGMTGDDGMASIMFARDDADGDMAYAAVTAPDGFGVGGDMQMIEWNAQSPMSAASNSQDVVNLKAEVSFAGATVETEMGGGQALAGWAIDVTMMDEDGEMVAVEGAPEMLDDEGMGMLMVEIESAADVGMTYYVNFDEDQEGEDADGNELDGGESYETVDAAMYTHNGLSVDTEMDAGTATARYTTQTLMVSVYHEVDQVPGFTGNIGTGDASIACYKDADGECVTGVDLQLRHETASNRRNTIDPDVWRWTTSGSNRTVWVNKGAYTFKHLPADLNLFVLADEIGHVEIVPADNLAAYEDRAGNGIEGGAFGSEGGFSHTVRLCPGRTKDPTGQDHGECGSFGFVHTHTVAAHVKKRIVEKDNDEDFKAEKDINVTGIELGLTPVTGKNMAGEAESITTLKSAVRSAGESSSSSAWDDEVDERQDLYFGRMAEGVYGVSLTSDWAAYLNGDTRIGREYRLKADDVMDVTDMTGAAGPFRPGDDSEGVYFEVRPTTSWLYGVVNDDSGDPLENVEVTVNGVTVMTDIDGRYIAKDFSRMTSRASRTAGAKLYVSFSKAGFDTLRDDPNHARSSSRYQIEDADGAKDGIDFEDNDPQRLDVMLQGSQLVATITGTVTDKDGDPVAGVDLTVINEDGEDVLNNRQWLAGIGYCTVGEGDAAVNCRRTGDDGTYEMQVKVTDDDEDYTITPSKNRYYFDNTTEQETLEAGDSEDGVDFEALRQSRIRGSVEDADGDNMGGVTVTATALDRDPVYAPSDETNDNGRFTIWVDGDETYNVMAMADGYTFGNTEDDDNLRVRVDDDELHDIGTFTGTVSDVGLSSVTVNGATVAAGTDGNYATEVANSVEQATIEATAVNSSATVTYSGTDADAAMAGHQVDLDVGANATTVTVTAPSGATMDYTVTVTRLDPVTLPDRKVTLVLGTNPIRENRGASAITATLNRAMDDPFVVTVSAPAVADGHSFTVSDNTELYFAAGATSSSSSSLGAAVTITAVPDNDYTGDTEVTVSGTVSSDSVAAPDNVMLTITEDDEPVRVSLTLSKTSIDEADDGATTDDVENASRLSVTLDRPAEAALSVAITVVGTGFDSGAGGLSAGTADTATATITIAEGATESTDTVTITATADEADAMDHSVTITGEATPEAGLVQPSGVTLTIEDDDEAPSAVTGLAARADSVVSTDSDKDVTLTWTAPTSFGSVSGTDTDSTTVDYQYRTKTSGAPSWGAWTAFTTAPTAGTGDDAGKQVGTVESQALNNTHQYQVRARATASGPAGPESNTAEVVIRAAPTT